LSHLELIGQSHLDETQLTNFIMNEDAQTYTSIQLTLSPRDRLKDLGKKGESYEDIIERSLEAYHQQKQGRK
jgi:hypothetical protein